MPTSVRLDEKTENLVRRLARQRRATKSEVIREALTRLARLEESTVVRPYEAIKRFIGCADSGGMRLSEKTGEKFRRLLGRKELERRSR